MEVKNLNLRFLTSNSYLDGSEFDLENQYNLKFEKHFFLENLKTPNCYDHHESVPNINYIFSFTDDKKLKLRKNNLSQNFRNKSTSGILKRNF